MKTGFKNNCDTVMNIVLESDKDTTLPFLTQLRINFHLLFCPDCSGKLQKLQYLDVIMKNDFFPLSPDFEDILMEKILKETEEELDEERIDIPAGFSFRGWVIIGFFVLFSLSSSFFGMNFIEIADAEGLSFLLPVGITIGIVLTCYGAFFIGSHLEELSARFRLR